MGQRAGNTSGLLFCGNRQFDQRLKIIECLAGRFCDLDVSLPRQGRGTHHINRFQSGESSPWSTTAVNGLVFKSETCPQ